MKNIKTMIKTELNKTLSDRKEAKKQPVSRRAGKLLLLFFALMLVFTIVSKAMASVTVAKVRVTNPQKDRLVYSVEGTGKILPEEEQLLKVLAGYRIAKVHVKSGEKVEPGAVLFSYSQEELKEKYTSIENEIRKIELLMEQERLRQQPVKKDPSRSAALALAQAKENLEVAITRLEEAEKEYENSKNSTKEELLKDKRKEYEAALKRYESLENSQKRQLIQAQRSVEDAQKALEETGETKVRLELSIEEYKNAVLSKDPLMIYEAQEKLFEAYYGDAEGYEKHQEEIYTLASAVAGEGNFLWSMQNMILFYKERMNTYREELQKLQSSTDPAVNSEANIRSINEKYKGAMNSYFNALENYEQQIQLLEDSFQNNSGDLKKLRKNDKLLKDYLKQFRLSIEDNKEVEEKRQKLFDFLYKDKKKALDEEAKEKTLELNRAKEDLALLEKEFDLENKNMQAETEELKKEIQSMEDGTYNYEEALESKKQEVVAAKEAVRQAKQLVKMQEVSKEEAEKVTDDATGRKISELTLQSYEIDLGAKEQELEEVRKLLEDSGEVKSPIAGLVTFVGVEEGRTTTGEELIKLGFGDYVFKATYDKEAAANIKEGATVKVNLTGKKKELELEIEEVTPGEGGICELMARIPEGEYFLGETAKFKAMTQSEQYDLCIPMQALREDNYGHYVLVTREQEDILGTQLIAERIEVTVLSKGNRTVAVDGALSSKSSVITDSNKFIASGDRIRIDY